MLTAYPFESGGADELYLVLFYDLVEKEVQAEVIA